MSREYIGIKFCVIFRLWFISVQEVVLECEADLTNSVLVPTYHFSNKFLISFFTKKFTKVEYSNMSNCTYSTLSKTSPGSAGVLPQAWTLSNSSNSRNANNSSEASNSNDASKQQAKAGLKATREPPKQKGRQQSREAGKRSEASNGRRETHNSKNASNSMDATTV